MKKVSGIIVGLLVCVMCLGGCAGKDENYNAWLSSADKANDKGAEKVIAYLDKGKAVDTEVIKGLAAKGNETAIALYGLMSKDRDAAVLNEFKVETPKAPTTQNDVFKAVASETIPTITRWGFGYAGVAKLSDALAGAGATTVTASDSATINLDNSRNTAGGNLSNISGDGSSSSQSTSTEVVGGNKDSNNTTTTTNGETPVIE